MASPHSGAASTDPGLPDVTAPLLSPATTRMYGTTVESSVHTSQSGEQLFNAAMQQQKEAQAELNAPTQAQGASPIGAIPPQHNVWPEGAGYRRTPSPAHRGAWMTARTPGAWCLMPS